jgi:hypothetical protein
MRSVPFTRCLIFIGFAGILVSSCENDLNPQSPDYEVIPVVFSVLELHRDTLTVRLTRTFAGTDDALNSARLEDSVYFPLARVWLEKWNGDILAGRAELVRTSLEPKVPGIFAEKPNWNYILVRAPETGPLFSGSVEIQEYQLSIEIPGLPLIFARTKAYPAASLLSPRLYIQQNLFMNPIVFTWDTTAPYSELYFRFYYTDVYDGTAIPRVISWREYHNLQPRQGFTEQVFGQDLMKRIASQIKADRYVLYRHVTGLEAVVVEIPTDLHDFRLMNQTQPPDQIGFPVTNIINGIGLFTSQTITPFELSPDQ